MISGTTSKTSKLSGNITPIKPLTGMLSENESLVGQMSVSVIDIEYYETSNPQGGTTVYIGKVVEKNGL